jgi:hypothetical protein
MWDARIEDIQSGRHFRIQKGGAPLSFRGLFGLLERDPAFTDWYAEVLAATDFSAFCWELPALSSQTFDRESEFVLIEAPSLARRAPDPRPFAAQFASAPDADVLSFANLGGDALLIVPRPLGPADAYPHLAAFLRQAPEGQVRSLWRHAAVAVRENIGRAPRWLSTAGLGVPWLHLRLDSSPKYYRFGPYRAAGHGTI